MKNGTYYTKAGSKLVISGKHSGIATLNFDWFEEENACSVCQPEPYPEELDDNAWYIVWHCDCCDGGDARVYPEKELTNVKK